MSQRHLEPVLPVPDSNILNHLQVKYPDFGACVHACVCERERERNREKAEGERESKEVKSSFPKKWQASLSKLILIKHITSQLSNPEEKNLLISKHSKSLLPHDLFASLL